MAFLLPTTFYLFTILFYSISHSLSIESSAGYPAGWNQEQSYFGPQGYRAPIPTIGNLCNNLDLFQHRKLICILCRGFDRSCLFPSIMTSTTSTTTSTTPSTTTSTSTTSTTTSTPPTTPAAEK
ncbi:integrator complex subunit 1 homolog [Spodoptera frugiperda]|uniref:Integrator complex subunit 1 homolog n=1 Tax=Spodoptera frugiperda TaxID=7108 RepID=A0A9R0ELT8_SPOFR|nr:integrator complex subunit 1 homolog [Spodoptera frugiperda]